MMMNQGCTITIIGNINRSRGGITLRLRLGWKVGGILSVSVEPDFWNRSLGLATCLYSITLGMLSCVSDIPCDDNFYDVLSIPVASGNNMQCKNNPVVHL